MPPDTHPLEDCCPEDCSSEPIDKTGIADFLDRVRRRAEAAAKGCARFPGGAPGVVLWALAREWIPAHPDDSWQTRSWPGILEAAAWLTAQEESGSLAAKSGSATVPPRQLRAPNPQQMSALMDELDRAVADPVLDASWETFQHVTGRFKRLRDDILAGKTLSPKESEIIAKHVAGYIASSLFAGFNGPPPPPYSDLALRVWEATSLLAFVSSRTTGPFAERALQEGQKIIDGAKQLEFHARHEQHEQQERLNEMRRILDSGKALNLPVGRSIRILPDRAPWGVYIRVGNPSGPTALLLVEIKYFPHEITVSSLRGERRIPIVDFDPDFWVADSLDALLGDSRLAGTHFSLWMGPGDICVGNLGSPLQVQIQRSEFRDEEGRMIRQ